MKERLLSFQTTNNNLNHHFLIALSVFCSVFLTNKTRVKIWLFYGFQCKHTGIIGKVECLGGLLNCSKRFLAID